MATCYFFVDALAAPRVDLLKAFFCEAQRTITVCVELCLDIKRPPIPEFTQSFAPTKLPACVEAQSYQQIQHRAVHGMPCATRPAATSRCIWIRLPRGNGNDDRTSRSVSRSSQQSVLVGQRFIHNLNWLRSKPIAICSQSWERRESDALDQMGLNMEEAKEQVTMHQGVPKPPEVFLGFTV
ncbi:hypothetical protein B0O80DRAFT_429789 [Mortierella sp. GBAus27b]|nr:hypothetical protein B0O80DRAFT_429789 [Mortierella sp. GBAus27b]